MPGKLRQPELGAVRKQQRVRSIHVSLLPHLYSVQAQGMAPPTFRMYLPTSIIITPTDLPRAYVVPQDVPGDLSLRNSRSCQVDNINYHNTLGITFLICCYYVKISHKSNLSEERVYLANNFQFTVH